MRVGSIPYQALLEALATCDVCASAETLVELERVLDLEKFDRYLDRALRQEFAAVVRRSVHLFAVKNDDLGQSILSAAILKTISSLHWLWTLKPIF